MNYEKIHEALYNANRKIQITNGQCNRKYNIVNVTEKINFQMLKLKQGYIQIADKTTQCVRQPSIKRERI